MALLTKSSLLENVKAKSGYIHESNIRNFAVDELLTAKLAADESTSTYDIFLSHAYEDAIYIKGLRDKLVESGFSVYVDWIDDPQLDRSHVTKSTAAVLRTRMKSCKSLLFVTSEDAKNSVWMPWELGYMDCQTQSRVAIVPIVEDENRAAEFKGQEYLGLYPYFDESVKTFWIHSSTWKWVRFRDWLGGRDPL